MPQVLMSPKILIEFLFTIAIIIITSLIYFKTKYAYELTNHKGIKYFRNTFLFFGLAFASRFLFMMFNLYIYMIEGFMPRKFFGPLPLLLLAYLSTAAILYLTLSIISKKINFPFENTLVHIIAIILAIFCTIEGLEGDILSLIIVELLLMIISIILVIKYYPKSKKFAKLGIVYFLLFLFWILNIAIIAPRWIAPRGTGLILNLFSLAIFLIIYYKVKKLIK